MTTEIEQQKSTTLHGTFKGVDIIGIPFEGNLYFPLSCIEKGLEYAEWGLTTQLARWIDKDLVRDGVHVQKFTNGRLAALKVAAGIYSANCRVDAKAHHAWMATEAGVYRILLLSKRPQAIAFQDWLEQDLLPTLNRTGSYALPGTAPQLTAPAPAPALPAPEAPPALPALSSVAARISLSLAALTPEEEAAYLIDQGDPSKLRRSPAPRDLAIGRILRLCRKSPDHLPALLSLLSRHSGQPLPSVTDAGEAPPRHAQMAQAVHLARALSTPQLVPALDTLTAAYLDARSARQSDPDRVALVGMCHEALLRLPPETLAEALVVVRQWGAGTARPVTTPAPSASAPVPPDTTAALVPSPASPKEDLAVRRERERRLMEAVVGRPVSAEELGELFWLEEMPWLRDGLYQVRRALHRSRRGASPARPLTGRPPMLAEEVRGSMGFSVVSWLLGLPEAELIEELAAWQQRQEKRGVRA